MTHKCPTEPCEDCWEESKSVGILLMVFGLITFFVWLTS